MRRLILSILLFSVFIQLDAADFNKLDSLNKYQRIDISYIFGGQVYNNTLNYNPGYSLQLSYGIMMNESVGFGFGIGHITLENERFLPVYLEAIGYKKNKESSPLIKMQVGYSFGWYSGSVIMNDYDFMGGFYFDAGVGRKISINDNYSLFFHWSYRHQFARMEYEVYGSQNYTEALNYDMLVISLGLIRH